jgi:tetratricopeptide (TPR) repeat protein
MPRFGATRAPLSLLFVAAAVCCWVLPFAPSRAAAQSARELFDQGAQAMNATNYADAAQKFDASYRKEPTAAALFNLGVAYRAMGHPSKALQAFESSAKFADPKKDPKTLEAARVEVDRMKNGYARYALKLTPDSATITIDDQPATTDEGELWVETGKHKIAFHASGYEDYQQTLEASAGRFDLEVNLRQAGAPEQRADELISEGIALQSGGDTIQAIEKFRQAQALFSTPRGAGLAGLSEEQVGDAGEADAHLDTALAAKKDKWVRKNRAKMMAAKRRLKKVVSTIDIEGEPAGALVTINDKPVGALPVGKLRVAGGTLLIKAKKTGYVDFETTVELPVRAERTVLIDMDNRPPPALVPFPEPAVAAVPALPPPVAEPQPVEPPPPEEPKSAQSDIEAGAEPPAPPPPEREPATGFEMALNFGYQPFIGGPKFEGASGLLSPQILLGARILWPLSFGIQINGGFNLSTPKTEFVVAANPGFYVRGHLQREKRPLGFDAWAGVGFQPVAMQAALLKSKKIDPTTIDINTLDDDAKAELAKSEAGLDHVHTLQSINIPFELGGTFFITEGFGVDLSLGLTLWLPQQDCLHDEKDRLCVDSGLSTQTSFFVGGGLMFLP